MDIQDEVSWIAFAQTKQIAKGEPQSVATMVKQHIDTHADENIQIFDAQSSYPVELDLRGTLSTILKRMRASQRQEETTQTPSESEATRSRGRPKLGVTAREVTLLPRHWEWLGTQPGGTSVALRKLVEEAMRANKEIDRLRIAQESAYRFMTTMAGNQPGYEEATRALFVGDLAKLKVCLSKWPADIRKHTLSLANETTAKDSGN